MELAGRIIKGIYKLLDGISSGGMAPVCLVRSLSWCRVDDNRNRVFCHKYKTRQQKEKPK